MMFGILLLILVTVVVAWYDIARRINLDTQVTQDFRKAAMDAHKMTQEKLDRNFQEMGKLEANDHVIVDNERFLMTQGCGK